MCQRATKNKEKKKKTEKRKKKEKKNSLHPAFASTQQSLTVCGVSARPAGEVMQQRVVRLCGEWCPSTWVLYRSDYSDNGDCLSYLYVDQIVTARP